MEEVEVLDNSSKSSIEVKTDCSPQMHKKSVTNSTLTSTGSNEAPSSVCDLFNSPPENQFNNIK